MFAFFPFSAALAQQNGTDTTELTPVEVRATRAGSRAPFTKTNLKREAIERQNLGQDLPFLLNSTPGVVVASDAGNGVGYTGIRIRGTDATRINVTLNGIPFNDAESQGTFFVNLPDFASSASSIQVQRGVGTSSNGAGGLWCHHQPEHGGRCQNALCFFSQQLWLVQHLEKHGAVGNRAYW